MACNDMPSLRSWFWCVRVCMSGLSDAVRAGLADRAFLLPSFTFLRIGGLIKREPFASSNGRTLGPVPDALSHASSLRSPVVADLTQICSPLVVKQIIYYARDKYNASLVGQPGPNVGRGVGLAIGLSAMLLVSSLGTHHFLCVVPVLPSF